ncbi:ABC transporter ATP-binding protein [Rhodococcus sp. 15-725-2-2b]|uniref:ABC transporter ATP-binding protein n=1 Tax=unclassified Rhodococcus (in: high G+C Gram-positive bacteria) TaxID=192944 RepID=UPI000B9B2F76|nr:MULTISPECIES: ATP-binding cassette domain-containing protein [unclassified Rhodococcus (in: high G+C Gram-positive bacteria)]OZC68875.1 ABC transporter ATP-binding protein [Rhodococcus sp. 06-469-3-2]OZD47571.1 ABC transporter ATP-binding protein [Rhodococcus sp. 06-1477-1A]OZE73460.1 ABC transporter ATP-binding protein [Rhodococcus sp. 15-725-2-2b]
MDIVRTHSLGKRYDTHTVVDDVNLRIPEGCVYGFLGPNGSGKSTTMKMLLSLIRPTSGEVEILGRPMNHGTRREVLSHIGSLIEAPPGYGHLTGAENLRIVQRSLGLHAEQIERAVATVRLQEHLDKKVKNYSLGMKQRLGIAMALAREPRLLILDEPTNGLDPAGIEEIRGLLRHLAEHGVTVMVSSHLLGEIDKTANMLGILSQGRLIFQGTRDELFAASTPDVLIDASDPSRASSILQQKIPVQFDDHTLRLSGIDDRGIAQVVAELVGANAGVYGVRRDDQSLEDVFMNLTKGGRL